jgi:hypothetical protein
VIGEKGGRRYGKYQTGDLDEECEQELPCLQQVKEDNLGEMRYGCKSWSCTDHGIRLGPRELRGVPVAPDQKASEHLQPHVADVDILVDEDSSMDRDHASITEIGGNSRVSKCINTQKNHLDLENIQFISISNFHDHSILSLCHCIAWGVET